jgi:hypothetical protein
MSWSTLHLLLITILYPISLKMEGITLSATMYGVISLSIAVGLLFMSRPPGPSLLPTVSGADAANSITGAAAFFGIAVPYILILVSPLIDMYNQKFKYSLVSIVGVVSMGLGYLVQRAVHGSVGSLTIMTIATSAMVGFLTQDVIAEPVSTQTRALSIIAMILTLGLQVLNSAKGTVYSSTILNDLGAVALGSGLGVISWIIVWSTDKTYLPYYVLTEKAK